jgi:hypothetical protein
MTRYTGVGCRLFPSFREKEIEICVSHLVNVFPDFKENVELLFELAQLEIEGIGTADFRHDVENVLDFLDLRKKILHFKHSFLFGHSSQTGKLLYQQYD